MMGLTRMPLALSLARYSRNRSSGTLNAMWFIEPTALVHSPMPGTVTGAETPGTPSGASGNQKNASALPPPMSKKKCWPWPFGRSSVLISRMPSTWV
jgi:hypothetical protein